MEVKVRGKSNRTEPSRAEMLPRVNCEKLTHPASQGSNQATADDGMNQLERESSKATIPGTRGGSLPRLRDMQDVISQRTVNNRNFALVSYVKRIND